MSVQKYSFERIEAICAGIEGLRSRVEIAAKPERLQHALRAAFYANRAALACTYNEEIKLPKCGLPKGYDPKADQRQVFVDIGLLLYNCISNGGRDFLPERDRAVLEQVRLDIAWSALDAAKGREPGEQGD